MVTTLINEIATSPTSAILVLDDYHVINAQPIHDAIIFLLENLPSQLHLVITCRADPPLPLSRLRARGQMSEVREEDLRFTFEESVTFLRDGMGLHLAAKEVQALENRTERWVTGLQLAGLSMQGRADVVDFIHGFTGSHRYILDYLTHEVLNRQPSEIRHFLLRTSVLARMCGPLCAAVLHDAILLDGENNVAAAQSFLETLDDANLFVSALDDERHWYRYHHLFGSLLYHYLTREMGSEEVNMLHQRAYDWYRQNGYPEDALEHALAAADYQRVIQLLETLYWSMMLQGEVNALRRWLQKLPDELVHSQPRLSLFYAWMLLASLRLEEIDPYVQNAAQILNTKLASENRLTPAEMILLSEVDAVTAFQVRVRGDAPAAIQLYRQALDRLFPDELVLRGVILVDLGRAYVMTDELADARQTLLDAIRLNKSIGHMQMALYGVSILAEVAVTQGRPHQAAARYRQTMQEIEAAGVQGPPIVANIYASLAQLYREWNDLEAAMTYAQKAIALGEERNFPDGLFQGYLVLGQLQQGHAEFDAAMQSFQEAERIIRRAQTPQWTVSLTAYQTRLWLRQYQDDDDRNKLQAALGWMYSSALGIDWRQQVATAFLPSHPPDFTHLTLARLFMAQGNLDESLDLLNWLYPKANAAGRNRSVVEILMLQAITLDQKGDQSQAYAALADALTLAEPAGYIRLFADEGPGVRNLLFMFCRQPTDIHQAYLDALLLACEEVEQNSPTSTVESQSPAAKRVSNQALIEPLSERELEVLGLVADGLSNREIADTLIISIGTVKRHVTNIHGKLGVRSRTQAIARANDVGILQ